MQFIEKLQSYIWILAKDNFFNKISYRMLATSLLPHVFQDKISWIGRGTFITNILISTLNCPSTLESIRYSAIL